MGFGGRYAPIALHVETDSVDDPTGVRYDGATGIDKPLLAEPTPPNSSQLPAGVVQINRENYMAGLLAARRPGHRNLLKTFVLQAFLPLGVTAARVHRPSPRACAVVQPAQRPRADRGPSAARRASSGGEICATVTAISIVEFVRTERRRRQWSPATLGWLTSDARNRDDTN